MQRRNRIRELRRAAGISLDDLAREVHVDPSTLHRWETGETKRLPADETLHVLADRLGVTVPFLMGWENNGDGGERVAA